MITTFTNYLRLNRGLSENTIKAYEEALRDFASWINDCYQGTTWSTVSKNMIDCYVADMVAEGYATSTIKQHISALRTFYKTCQALGGQTENPARYVSTPKRAEQLPQAIETSAIKSALDDTNVDAQTKAAIAIIFETGLRLQELLDLRATDIDSQTSSIKVHGKGNKERTVYYGDLTRTIGRCWHGELHTQREVRHMVYNALKPYSKADHLCPHAIRHTYATQLLNNGMTMAAISKLMGHRHIETTERYATLANTSAWEQYEAHRPRL